MITIYYKDGQLNRSKTARVLLGVYARDLLAGKRPRKIIVESSERSISPGF